jgi:hypothetical protein
MRIVPLGWHGGSVVNLIKLENSLYIDIIYSTKKGIPVHSNLYSKTPQRKREALDLLMTLEPCYVCL